MRSEDVRALALMLPGVEEGAHMGHPDFRVGGRIFATLWVDEERVVLKFPAGHQALVVEAEPDLYEPIPGAWGRRGWTSLFLDGADEEALRGALLTAWRCLAPDALRD